MAWFHLQANLAGVTGVSAPLLLNQFFISIRARWKPAGVSTWIFSESTNNIRKFRSLRGSRRLKPHEQMCFVIKSLLQYQDGLCTIVEVNFPVLNDNHIFPTTILILRIHNHHEDSSKSDAVSIIRGIKLKAIRGAGNISRKKGITCAYVCVYLLIVQGEQRNGSTFARWLLAILLLCSYHE